MIEQLKTIREALLLRDMESCEEALAALTQLEAMVGAQEPEIWKDVVGFEGAYQISSEGRLKNVKTDYILRSASLMGGGYVKADLFKDGARTQTTIHRLVAEAFLGNTEGMEVNHINGVKTDNRIANLEVVTRSENEQHSRDVLGRLVKPVIATNLETGDETEYASIEAAGRDGFEPSCVYRCVRADHRIHKGHKFRLKNPEQLHVKHFLEAAPVAQQPQAHDAEDAACWRWLSEHIDVAWSEGGFTRLVRIVSDKHRAMITASVKRMMAGDWSDAHKRQQEQPQAECAMCGGMGYIDGIGNRCGLCDGMGRQPQAEDVEVPNTFKLPGESDDQWLDRITGAAPQQAEAVPSDVTDAMVVAGARALCNRFADTGGVSREDQWNIYAEDFKDDARAVLNAAIAQQKGGV